METRELIQSATALLHELPEKTIIGSLFSGNPQERRWRASKGEEPIVAPVRAQVAQLISEHDALPREVKENPYYQAFFLNDFARDRTGLEAFLNIFGNQALFVPHQKNEREIQKKIEEIGRTIREKLDLDSANDQILALAIRELFESNLAIFAATPILNTEDETRVAPRDFKKAFKKVNKLLSTGALEREEATFALLFLSGIISEDDLKTYERKSIVKAWAKGFLHGVREKWYPRKEDDAQEKLFEVLRTRDIRPLMKEIEESLAWSREHIGTMVKLFKDIMSEYEADGSLPHSKNTPPDLNNELASHHDSWDWIQTFYDKETHLRDHNDAHLMLLYGLIDFQEKKRMNKLEARHKKGILEDKLVEKLFVAKNGRVHAEVPTLKLRGETFEINKKDEDLMERILECRQLDPNNFEAGTNKDDLAVHLTAMGHKERPSRVRKRLSKKSRGLGPNKMVDETRIRIVFVNINSKEANTESKGEIFIKTMINAAKSLGFSPNKRRTDLEENGKAGLIERPGLLLEKGEFIIENDLAHDRYPKINLIGRMKDGTYIEIQGIPLDTYLFEEAHGSGMNHSVKELDETLEMLQAGSPQTISPLVHDVANKKRGEIIELRNRTKTARLAYPIETLKPKIIRTSHSTKRI